MLINDHFQNETWKPISGFNEAYEVSDLGNIRSIKRTINQFGHKTNYNRVFSGKILKPRTQNSGYLLIWLSKNGISKPYLMHRLIALEFIPNTQNYLCVNHKDGDKLNNQVDNLEWCNHSENLKHAYRVLKQKRNSKPVKCVELNQIFPSMAEAAKKFNMSKSSIYHVLVGRNKTAGGYTWERA